MTAKEKLRMVIEDLSESEAAEALELIPRSSQPDALDELLDSAPADDEPTTPEEDEGAREAREQIARDELFSAGEIKRGIA
jgi:hypothetical protein